VRPRVAAWLFLGLVAIAHAQESERELRLRAFGAASRADTLGLLVGRVLVEKRWNEILDEMLYAVAPRGAWDERHPAWKPARAVLAAALRRATAARAAADPGRLVHAVVVDYYLDGPNAEERERATAFFASHGGTVWLETRQRYLEERTYGLPFRDETEPRAAFQRRAAEGKKALLHLPKAETNAVYEFNESPLGERLLAAQNRAVADAAGNVLRSELDAVAVEEQDAVVAEVRARVPGLPPASEKTHLGTVTMQADHAFDVVVEQTDHFRHLGTYPFHYAPDAPHWSDVAAGAPGIAPGETRHLYRDARGRLSDRP
jgi:hypothetical protein